MAATISWYCCGGGATFGAPCWSLNSNMLGTIACVTCCHPKCEVCFIVKPNLRLRPDDPLLKEMEKDEEMAQEKHDEEYGEKHAEEYDEKRDREYNEEYNEKHDGEYDEKRDWEYVEKSDGEYDEKHAKTYDEKNEKDEKGVEGKESEK